MDSNRKRQTLSFLLLVFLAASLVLPACGRSAPPGVTPSPSLGASATLSATPLPTLTGTSTVTLVPTFAPPALTPITPIPPAVKVNVPADVQVAVLMGSDTVTPYVGRTKAFALLIFNQKLARASLVSFPPDMFVYLPGYTMQRLSIAYAVGGFKQVSSTVRYNFGLDPSIYVMAHMNDLVYFVDDLGGITVDASQPVPEYCGDNPAGKVRMDGQQAFCYMRLRFGEDEADRDRRQQEVYYGIFKRLVHGGTLVRLPALYNSYKDSIETNLSLADLSGYIPLAIRLGDPNRTAFYYLSNSDLTPWHIPDKQLQPVVLLPNRAEIQSTIQKAIDFVMIPAPLSPLVSTLAAELTLTPTPTRTPTITPTITRTPPAYRSPTPVRSATPTVTGTPPTATPITPTPTVTGTPPTPTAPPPPTATPTPR